MSSDPAGTSGTSGVLTAVAFFPATLGEFLALPVDVSLEMEPRRVIDPLRSFLPPDERLALELRGVESDPRRSSGTSFGVEVNFPMYFAVVPVSTNFLNPIEADWAIFSKTLRSTGLNIIR